MRTKPRRTVAAIAGALLWSGSAVAQQPINLLGPSADAPLPGTAIQATPLPPPSPLAPPLTGATARPYATVTTLPMLPATVVASYDAAVPYLESAQSALAGRRDLAAREALEQAETSLLNDGMTAGPDIAGPLARHTLLEVRLARHALAFRDRADALAATGRALASIGVADRELATAEARQATPPARIAPIAQAAADPPVPMITKALLPGHWQLDGWQYRWVPPETRLRPVDTRQFQPGHYVWRDGAWAWDAGHYGSD